MKESFGKVVPRIEDAAKNTWPSEESPKVIITAREFLLQGQEWVQLPAVLAREVLADIPEHTSTWHALLAFFKDLDYRVQINQTERKKVAEFLAEADGKPAKNVVFVGPERYDPDRPLLEQRARAQEEGIQCQVVIHVYFESILGVRLPGEWRSAELFSDKNTISVLSTTGLSTPDIWQPGDIGFFHAKPTVDPRALHVAVCVGKDMAGVPWLLHATHYKNEKRQVVDVWPLSRFLANPSYAHLYDVRRIPDLDRLSTASMV